VLLRALQKREELELPNIYFMCVDAAKLHEIFAPGEISKIYLNFSDPWPKDRHAKRRLTSPEFMKVYDQVLQKNGRVEFKTDNQGLFSYSLESIPEAGWKIEAYTRDLHHSDMADGNVMTEYETKFSSMGHPICKLIAGR
jgi:tRNA (guanine-N7-)-methyltransferase